MRYFLHLDIILYTNHGPPVSVHLGTRYLPLTEAGVEGGPEELFILTPGTEHRRSTRPGFGSVHYTEQ